MSPQEVMLSKLTKPLTGGNGPCYRAFSWACNSYQMRFQVIRFAFNCYQTGEHERSSTRMARTPNRLKWLLFWNSPPCTTGSLSLLWPGLGNEHAKVFPPFKSIFAFSPFRSTSACLLVAALSVCLCCCCCLIFYDVSALVAILPIKLVFDLILISAKNDNITFSV